MHLAILGLGFIGRALADQAAAEGHRVDGFSRSSHLGGGSLFDARDSGAVSALVRRQGSSPYDALVITFPPQDIHERFLALVHGMATRRALLGTTSIYQRAQDCSQPVITEMTALVQDHPRRVMEESFCEGGGVVVRLAGLYGGERNPVRWIRSGRVGYEKRQANLVHRDDVARALLALLSGKARRSVYNLADGERHTWREIIDHLVSLGALAPMPPKPLSRGDAFVDPSALLSDLPGFAFRSLYDELSKVSGDRRKNRG